MGLFDRLFKNTETLPEISDEDIVSLGTGNIIPVSEVSDLVFSQEMMGKTCAFKLTEKTVLCPINGTVEVSFPTGHAFGLRMNDGTGILVHIGVDTVNLGGKGFKTFLKVGDKVRAGQKAVEVDWSVIESAGLDSSVMLIITEPKEGKTYNFRSPGPVEKYQSVIE